MTFSDAVFLGALRVKTCVYTSQTWYMLLSLYFCGTVELFSNFSLFVLRFYGPVNPMGSCRARSVYLTTRLLGRLSPLSG